MDDHIFHLGIVDSVLGTAAPRILGRGIAVVDADEVEGVEIEVERSRSLTRPPKTR